MRTNDEWNRDVEYSKWFSKKIEKEYLADKIKERRANRNIFEIFMDWLFNNKY